MSGLFPRGFLTPSLIAHPGLQNVVQGASCAHEPEFDEVSIFERFFMALSEEERAGLLAVNCPEPSPQELAEMFELPQQLEQLAPELSDEALSAIVSEWPDVEDSSLSLILML